MTPRPQTSREIGDALSTVRLQPSRRQRPKCTILAPVRDLQSHNFNDDTLRGVRHEPTLAQQGKRTSGKNRCTAKNIKNLAPCVESGTATPAPCSDRGGRLGHQELHNYAEQKKHNLFEAIEKHAATKKWTPSRSIRWRIMAPHLFGCTDSRGFTI